MLIIAFLPLIIVFAPSVTVAEEVWRMNRGRDKGIRVLFTGLAFIGMLLATPIVFLVGIPIGIIYLISKCIKRIARLI